MSLFHNNALGLKRWNPLRILALVLLCSPRVLVAAEEVKLPARVTFQLPDGVYVDVGTESGLVAELTGQAHHVTGTVWTFEVQHSARKTALLRLRALDPREDLRGTTLELVFDRVDAPVDSGRDDPMSPTVDPNATDTETAFVPLLTPVQQTPKSVSSRNVGHGHVQVNQAWQSASDSRYEYGVTRMSTAGSLERLQASPWSFEWSGQATYRTGNAYQSHKDYQDIVPYIHLASLYRPLPEDGFVRLGRFLPRELPGVGYLDGAQSEVQRADVWRFGVAGGLKPGRTDLAVSGDEPTVVGYTTLEAGERNNRYYSGTLGLLGSLYDGQADRLAILWDQKADLGSRSHLYGTLEFDLGIADTPTQEGPQLTRLDYYVTTQLTRVFTLRGGIDHWERPDTQAERARLGFDDNRFFDAGYWRYWIGGQQRILSHWTASQEISLMDSGTAENYTHWRLGLARHGLANWSGATLRGTIFNLEGGGLDGYGATFSAYLPLYDARWSLQPALGFRWVETQAQSPDLSITYLSLRFDGRLNNAWTAYGGISPSTGDSADATLFDLGLRYRW